MVRASLAILLLSVSAQAQLTRTSESIEVNVVEVDVVVLDAHGAPVTGLHPADFELRVGGHKRQITNFYEINRREDAVQAAKAGAAQTAPAARRDYVVLFIDDLHLNQHEKKRALDGLRTFVKQHVGRGTAAMLVSCDGSLHILCRFTENPEPVISAIDDFERKPAHVSEFQRERHELLNFIDEQRAICQDPKQSRACAAETIPQRIETFAQLESHMVAQTTDSLSYMATAMSGLDGRRVLVYVSDGLSMQPGAEVYQYFKPDEFKTGDNNDITKILQQSQPMDALGHNLGESMQLLAKETALNGVQFFAINARGVQGFDEGVESRSASSRLDSSLIRANLNSTLQLMADETGGRAIIDENDMDLAFTKLDDHLASYYSLGFVSDGTDKSEDVSVSVKRKGMAVRATKHVRQRTAREAIADRVRSSLYSRLEDNPLDARITLVPLAEKSGLKATITIPTSKLSILPQDIGYGASFSVFVAMMDDQLRETAVRMFVHKLSAAETNESVQTLTLEVPPGTYTVSLAVADSYSSTVSYVQDDIRIGPTQ
jgi:VWFA-related protein